MNDLTRTIMVTGAGKGLGYALVEEGINKGFHMIAVVRKARDAEKLRRQFKSKCVVITVDITKAAAEAAIRRVLTKKGIALDAVINNAGIAGSGSCLVQTDLRNLRALLDVHCIGALRCTRAALDSLRKSSRRVVVNITSRLGSITNVAAGQYTPELHSYSYRIAKASQNMATACLHAEFNTRGFIVLAIHPGKLRTSLSHHSEGKTPVEAANQLLSLILSATKKMSGTFRDLDGNELKW